jgi:hypothetical protein
LNERILRVDPAFTPEDLDALKASILRDQKRERERAEVRKESAGAPRSGVFDVRGMIEDIGNPDWERMLMAAAVAASLPDNVRHAAQSTEWAPEVLFYALLDVDEDLRERQLGLLGRRMGQDSEQQVRALLQSAGSPHAEQRLPLLDLAFPALKRRPPDFVRQVLDTVKAMVDADGRVDVFEYLLARVISQHLWESQNPDAVRSSGTKRLKGLSEQALQVLAVLARHGHDDPATALAAYHAGREAAGLDANGMPGTGNWDAALDAALPVLDRLRPADKERFVGAMAIVVTFDDRMVPAELELLRAACALIHVPLPLLSSA